MLTLVHGGARCDLHPDIGGSIGCWSIAGQDLLRSASEAAIAAGDPLGMASFPLLPYSNRIGDARFIWEGEVVALRPNFAPEPHAIHGIGWRRPWSVGDCMAASARLSLTHDGDADWPWPFLAEQHVELGDGSMRLTISATNLADRPVPLGFGHHPFFDAENAALRFGAAQIWASDSRGLPVGGSPPAGRFDFANGGAAGKRGVDNCYSGVASPARIDWAGRPLALEIDMPASLPAAVVYSPDEGDFFCFEPVPHLNNALNLPGSPAPMPVIAPGARFAASIVFRAVAA